MEDLNRKWLGEQVSELLRRDDPFNRHVSLPQEHHEVPILLVDVLGAGSDPWLICDGDCSSVIFEHSAVNLCVGKVDIYTVQIGIGHQVNQEDILPHCLGESYHFTFARAEADLSLQLGTPSDWDPGIANDISGAGSRRVWICHCLLPVF